jgi:hypothetical protein
MHITVPCSHTLFIIQPKPLLGRYRLAGRARMFIRKALDSLSLWPSPPVKNPTTTRLGSRTGSMGHQVNPLIYVVYVGIVT